MVLMVVEGVMGETEVVVVGVEEDKGGEVCSHMPKCFSTVPLGPQISW